jgi:hypothetical protein
MGIQELEVSIPALGETERKSIAILHRLGLKADLNGWNRAVVPDITASLTCGLKRVHISVPVSALQIEVEFQEQYHRLLNQLREGILDLFSTYDNSTYDKVGDWLPNSRSPLKCIPKTVSDSLLPMP